MDIGTRRTGRPAIYGVENRLFTTLLSQKTMRFNTLFVE